MDDVLGQAQAVAGNIREQGNLFENVGGKLENVAQRFPLVRGLLTAIRRKKNRASLLPLHSMPVMCRLLHVFHMLIVSACAGYHHPLCCHHHLLALHAAVLVEQVTAAACKHPGATHVPKDHVHVQ
jgi:hypothetical protein